MLRAVLFDLGDTLLDFEPMDTRAVFRRAAKSTYEFLHKKGCSLPPFKTYCNSQFSAVRWSYLWAKLRGREFNSLELLAKFCRTLNAPLDEASLNELAWLWYEPLTEHSSAEDGLYAMLAGLRRSGLKLALVSNTFVPGSVLDRHLTLHGLLEFFPVRIYSSEVGFRKPDPRIFQIALARLGVLPGESMFVGDLLKTDIIGARKLGMITVLKQPWGTTKRHKLADFVVRRISELPVVLDQVHQREREGKRLIPSSGTPGEG